MSNVSQSRMFARSSAEAGAARRPVLRRMISVARPPINVHHARAVASITMTGRYRSWTELTPGGDPDSDQPSKYRYGGQRAAVGGRDPIESKHLADYEHSRLVGREQPDVNPAVSMPDQKAIRRSSFG